MKRLISQICTIALVAGVLFICLSCKRAEAGNKVVIRISNWGGVQDDNEYERTIKALYDQFEKENPDTDVVVERVAGEYVPKMLLSFVAGAEPDIMTLDASSAAVFMNNGVLKDLSPLMEAEKDFNLDDYFPNVVDIARRGDKLFAVPIDFTPMVLYYNKKMFRDAGVPYPKPGWTWDEFRATAKSLTRGEDQYGFVFANWMPGWIMWLWNNGGDVLSPDGTRASGYLDSPQNAEAVSFLRDIINVDKSAPTLSQAESMGVDLFAQGNAAMTIVGHWAIVGYKAPGSKIRVEDLGVVELPRKVHDQSVTVIYEAGLAMSKNCKHPEEAWRLIKFLTSYRYQKAYNSTGIAICARKDIAEEHAQGELEESFLRIVPSGRVPWGAKVEGYDYVETMGVQLMDSVLKQGRDPQQALTMAAKKIDKDFARK
ncbi:MAG: sugar ABC transporter substrate-binding protein [Fimbriimonadaceae bacterium]|nr:sugar ABC transporter substrate-binding protein [Fimbriimonadaceae bacterium]